MKKFPVCIFISQKASIPHIWRIEYKLPLISVINNGKQAIINSPILNFEITQTVSVGMFIKYQMAAFLGVFAITMLVQFISYYFTSLSSYGENLKKMKEN